ncbi:hypothetical protein UVI_02025210 [Ustilaginoidea virens]|uniref:Uncharacterized protein n=1 Tax=Ustilaginoidea virens TaxID=1159556 RepID=A0A1B5KR26_USTVR|nr:hypothetical protein UVI_02025210 [Ustilaginoidea virens]
MVGCLQFVPVPDRDVFQNDAVETRDTRSLSPAGQGLRQGCMGRPTPTTQTNSFVSADAAIGIPGRNPFKTRGSREHLTQGKLESPEAPFILDRFNPGAVE